MLIIWTVICAGECTLIGRVKDVCEKGFSFIVYLTSLSETFPFLRSSVFMMLTYMYQQKKEQGNSVGGGFWSLHTPKTSPTHTVKQKEKLPRSAHKTQRVPMNSSNNEQKGLQRKEMLASISFTSSFNEKPNQESYVRDSHVVSFWDQSTISIKTETLDDCEEAFGRHSDLKSLA